MFVTKDLLYKEKMLYCKIRFTTLTPLFVSMNYTPCHCNPLHDFALHYTSLHFITLHHSKGKHYKHVTK